MEQSKIDQMLMLNASKLPPVGIDSIKSKLQMLQDETKAQIAFSQLKDPTTAIILSVLCGGLGIDRFYIGDTGLGVGKLLTCGGGGIWALIDIFLIMDATRRKNLELLLMQIG